MLYLRRCQGELDALLALVRRVLRLDESERPSGEDDVAREQVDLEDLGRVVSTEQVEVEAPAEQGDGPHVDTAALDRYRAAHAGAQRKARFAQLLESKLLAVSSRT